MLDAVRQIGIFMIAAQAVVHFAPGKQYERYIKSVSGIIILLLFLKPVLQFAGAVWEDPQDLWERWADLTDMPELSGELRIEGAEEVVTGRMESEVRELLNRELESDACCVSRVSLSIVPETEAADASCVRVEVALKEKAEEGVTIEVEDIVIGQSRQAAREEALLSYRTQFAEALGVEEEQMEVRWDG